jgi:putative ABC transport system substrate-binding protein
MFTMGRLSAVRRLALVALFLLLAVPLLSPAQTPARPWRIGYLATVPLTSPDAARNWSAFEQALKERGYVEGRNVVFERRFSDGSIERFPALAAELAERNVDVIVVVANAAAHVVKQTTATIPVVMLMVANPVGARLVASLAHPGGNITGVADYQTELVTKRFELLKATLPNASRVAMVACERCTATGLAHVDAATLAAARARREAAVRNLGVTLAHVDLSSPEDFERATAAVLLARPDALFLYPSPVNYFLRWELAQFASRHRIPLFAPLREQAEAGALMSYGPNQLDQYVKAADYVDRILRGAKPADLPIEQPTTLELVINRGTARALNIVIPPSVAVRAHEMLD